MKLNNSLYVIFVLFCWLLLLLMFLLRLLFLFPLLLFVPKYAQRSRAFLIKILSEKRDWNFWVNDGFTECQEIEKTPNNSIFWGRCGFSVITLRMWITAWCGKSDLTCYWDSRKKHFHCIQSFITDCHLQYRKNLIWNIQRDFRGDVGILRVSLRSPK